MGKRYNNTASAFGINIAGQVGHVPVKKKEILKVSDEYNANTDQKNQEVLLPRKLMEEIYGIYNYYHKGWADWDKMSRKEKIAYASVVGLTAFGIVAAADYVSNGAVKDTAKKTYDKLFSKSSSKAVVGAPAVIAADKVIANETAKPTATPAPSYDYYDEEFKVGIVIEGSPSEKTNITNLIEAWKKTTPEDYRDKFPYAPKRIFVSADGFNAYGGSNDNDYIRLDRTNEIRGGSDDLKTRLVGVVDMEAEFGNAKRSKTGVRFSSGYESEMDVNIRKANYAVKVGVWTQEQADRYIENISKRINPNGTYKN